MQYARLGDTGLLVSRLAFGAMTFGEAPAGTDQSAATQGAPRNNIRDILLDPETGLGDYSLLLDAGPKARLSSWARTVAFRSRAGALNRADRSPLLHRAALLYTRGPKARTKRP